MVPLAPKAEEAGVATAGSDKLQRVLLGRKLSAVRRGSVEGLAARTDGR
jgi:hypothetical protein